MTTKANKHGLRAAAQERTNRHAQRTPLPPKAGAAEAAREAIAETASSNGDGPDARSLGKAQSFLAKAAELGWTGDAEERDTAVEVTVTRGAETVVQAWDGGVWAYDASVYAYGDRNTKPRNASGALKLLARSEADAKAEASKVQSNRHFRKSEPKDIVETLEKAQKSLPFDPMLATDEEICAALAGQAVVWYNRIGRSNESAIVSRSGVRITYLDGGERVANICCPVTGYRSFLVTAILKVGRGKSNIAKGSDAPVAVEVS
jgi:hypothetical protein